MINLTNQKKIDIFTARNNRNPETFRSIEKRVNIDHSTLHSIEPRIREEIENALKTISSSYISYKKFVVKVVLTLSLLGQMSSRAIAQSVKLLYGKDISHDTVLNILCLSSKVAQNINHEWLDLGKVKTALFDEIYQSKTPILGFTDHYSCAILLKKANDRSTDSWVKFLNLLKSLGLQPSTVITDGGTGLKAALILKFGDSVVYVLDLFHFLKKIVDAKKKMEGFCYSLIKALDDLIDRGCDRSSVEYKKLFKKMNLSIETFDQYETICTQISKHVYLCDHQNGLYVDSNILHHELLECAALLNEFYQNIKKHKKINDARSYVENNIKQLIAYKQNIENEVRKEYPELSQLIFKYFLPIIENIDQFQRSYENSNAQKYWADKILSLKKEIIINENISEKTFNELLNNVGKITSKFAKSNSLIENVNNQIRRFCDTYKSIPSGFCELFSYYWNFRKFQRGKRKGYAPIELLTNKKLKSSWIDLILDNFPYDKIRTNLNIAQ